MNTENVLLKIYGNLYPADDALFQALRQTLSCALPSPDDPIVELEGDLLRISFEGIYAPLDTLLHCLTTHLSPQLQGKVDILDLEAWTLTRHTVQDGTVRSNTAPLNNVLAYSGH